MTEVKRDMISMRHELDVVHHVKEEIEDLRECVDRIDEQTRRRKTRLLEQVSIHFRPHHQLAACPHPFSLLHPLFFFFAHQHHTFLHATSVSILHEVEDDDVDDDDAESMAFGSLVATRLIVVWKEIDVSYSLL